MEKQPAQMQEQRREVLWKGKGVLVGYVETQGVKVKW